MPVRFNGKRGISLDRLPIAQPPGEFAPSSRLGNQRHLRTFRIHSRALDASQLGLRRAGAHSHPGTRRVEHKPPRHVVEIPHGIRERGIGGKQLPTMSPPQKVAAHIRCRGNVDHIAQVMPAACAHPAAGKAACAFRNDVQRLVAFEHKRKLRGLGHNVRDVALVRARGDDAARLGVPTRNAHKRAVVTARDDNFPARMRGVFVRIFRAGAGRLQGEIHPFNRLAERRVQPRLRGHRHLVGEHRRKLFVLGSPKTKLRIVAANVAVHVLPISGPAGDGGNGVHHAGAVLLVLTGAFHVFAGQRAFNVDIHHHVIVALFPQGCQRVRL